MKITSNQLTNNLQFSNLKIIKRRINSKEEKKKSIMVETRAMVKKELAERKEAEAAQLYERIMCNLEKPITKRLMLLMVCGTSQRTYIWM